MDYGLLSFNMLQSVSKGQGSGFIYDQSGNAHPFWVEIIGDSVNDSLFEENDKKRALSKDYSFQR